MFCKKCGTKQGVGDKFCRKCGTPCPTSYDNEVAYIPSNSPFVVTEGSSIESSKNDTARKGDNESIISTVDPLRDAISENIVSYKDKDIWEARVRGCKNRKISYKKLAFYPLMTLCIFFGIKHFTDNGSDIDKFNESLSVHNVIYKTPIYLEFYSLGWVMGYRETDAEIFADKIKSYNLTLMFFPKSKTEGKVSMISYSLDFQSYFKSSIYAFRYRIENDEILIHSGISKGVSMQDILNPRDIRLKMSLSGDGNIQLEGMCRERERVFTKMTANFNVGKWEYDY